VAARQPALLCICETSLVDAMELALRDGLTQRKRRRATLAEIAHLGIANELGRSGPIDQAQLVFERALWLSYLRVYPPPPNRNRTCRACRRRTVLPMVFGMPPVEHLEAAWHNRLVIAGVAPAVGSFPGWACAGCGIDQGRIRPGVLKASHSSALARAIAPFLGVGLGAWPGDEVADPFHARYTLAKPRQGAIAHSVIGGGAASPLVTLCGLDVDAGEWSIWSTHDQRVNCAACIGF